MIADSKRQIAINFGGQSKKCSFYSLQRRRISYIYFRTLFYLTPGSTNGVGVMLGGESKRDHNRERDTICLSLDGLRRAARLCCTLGIQTRCELVLAQLANASCGIEGLDGKRGRSSFSAGHIKLHAAHVLSMDGLLAVGVELGSHAPKCWKHVFR